MSDVEQPGKNAFHRGLWGKLVFLMAGGLIGLWCRDFIHSAALCLKLWRDGAY
ncbi:MAG: hypothetical protein IJC63_09075 [Myxococcaceae bacterium]|nr:hypothetical protein [Myxococcaceae bacterium]